MKALFPGIVSAIAFFGTTTTAVAGLNHIRSVPVDSPWAIVGLGAVVALVAARLLINRNR